MPDKVGSSQAPTVQDMAAQSEALLAKQMAMNMQSERSTAASNAEKTRHDAMMAVISNFKN